MEEKKCRYCAIMIPKEAKICPHCRKKFGLTWPAKIFLILVLLGFIGYIGGSSKQDNKISSPVYQIELTGEGHQIKDKHPNWTNDICNLVAARKIQIGMSTDQAIAAWGIPEHRNETVGSWGKHEQWVYGDQYVYFENGILTSFQNTGMQ